MEQQTLEVKKEKKEIKAIALISGGLDSAIATKLIIDQGIKVEALNFHSPFCTCSSNSKYNQCGATYFAQKLEIPIKHISKGDDYLEIVRNPKFGYGKNINPSIECRIHILEKTKEYMKEIGAKFIITGEVLGQRPKSQMLHALKTIEKTAELEGKIIRPLSAQLLSPTEMEIEGIIDRAKLLGIQGRRRNIQVQLGRDFKLIEQYCASGGCRLTDKNFARKLRDYFQYHQKSKMSDMKFLKIGRHFRFLDAKIIVGRDEGENDCLLSWARPDDVILYLKDITGPTLLVEHPESMEILEFAAKMAVKYSGSNDIEHSIKIESKNTQYDDFIVKADPNIENLIKEFRI
ncbi:MAG: hypothetical protein ACTSVL_11805 [Promethearchaeota archaeon]